jgi:hypothetical protein
MDGKKTALIGGGISFAALLVYLIAIGVSLDTVYICDSQYPLEQNQYTIVINVTSINGSIAINDSGQYSCNMGGWVKICEFEKVIVQREPEILANPELLASVDCDNFNQSVGFARGFAIPME